MKVVKYPDMYILDGKTVKKFTKEKYPMLYKYVVFRRETIINDYNEWLEDQKNGQPNMIVCPRIVVNEKFFTKLNKEVRNRERCIGICWDSPDKLVTRIMGVGFYNDELHAFVKENSK